MKVKEKKTKAEVPFDPVLFAATVPSRKPTPKDIADSKERKDEPSNRSLTKRWTAWLKTYDLPARRTFQTRVPVAPA